MHVGDLCIKMTLSAILVIAEKMGKSQYLTIQMYFSDHGALSYHLDFELTDDCLN